MIKQGSQALKYRILWTWDRLICDRTKKSFLGNYKKLIDYMSDHDLNGVILWGFLDDQHGGEEAAVEPRLLGRFLGTADRLNRLARFLFQLFPARSA